jgi:hypothetical protein
VRPCCRAFFHSQIQKFRPLLRRRVALEPTEPSRDPGCRVFLLALFDCARRPRRRRCSRLLFYSPSFSLFPSSTHSTDQQDASLQVLGLEDLPRTRHPLHQDGQPGEFRGVGFSLRSTTGEKSIDASPLAPRSLSLSSLFFSVAVSHFDPRRRSSRLSGGRNDLLSTQKWPRSPDQAAFPREKKQKTHPPPSSPDLPFSTSSLKKKKKLKNQHSNSSSSTARPSPSSPSARRPPRSPGPPPTARTTRRTSTPRLPARSAARRPRPLPAPLSAPRSRSSTSGAPRSPRLARRRGRPRSAR